MLRLTPMACLQLRSSKWLVGLMWLALLAGVRPAGAYSVLSHEEVVDMAWRDTLVPMIKARFPGITADDLRQAHAYAYGGSVIQDIGYYPFGSHYFSDLLHYVRPADFVTALIRDSKTPDEYAFALGSLAHYCGDTVGHPAVNVVTAEENPKLAAKFGTSVTYAENPTAHIRTEFGFDVVEVAQGHYSQQNYRDFIGFQVAKGLMERAFQETYGITLTSVMPLEELAIGSYRRSVSSIIPKMTTVAFVQYKGQIQSAQPGIDKRRFIYRLKRTEYEKSFGTDYNYPGFGSRVLAGFLSILPKVGPLKALKVTIADPKEQAIYLKSINSTVDRFKVYLAEIHADPAPLPPPDPADVVADRKAAAKVAKSAKKANKDAAAAQDPDDKAKKEQIAENVQKASDRLNKVADRKAAEVAAVEAAPGGVVPLARGAMPATTPVTAPSTPWLPELDMDTGRPSSEGEYHLADETYAHLVEELVKQKGGAGSGLDPKLVADLEHFFANPVPRTGPPPTKREAAKEEALRLKVQAGLASLKKTELAARLP